MKKQCVEYMVQMKKLNKNEVKVIAFCSLALFLPIIVKDTKNYYWNNRITSILFVKTQ